MPCVGASLISSHNPSAACPSGCPGSVGHSYALLRQQAKNNGGEGKLAGHLNRPTHWKEHNHERQEVSRALLEHADREGTALNHPQESVDNIIEIPYVCTCPLRPV